jgi:hypothetical protein
MIGSIDQIVNQQVLRWQEERRIAERKQLAAQQPMLCISREYGARGGELGRIVAERIGFRYYAQELIHEIAEAGHVRKQVVESLDERIRDSISEWVTGLMKRGGFAPSDYLRNLSKVVLTLGRHGSGVIIGRGANFILDPKMTLRIRTIAPLDMRVARIAERDKLDAAAARATVLRIDGERVAFNRQHYGVDIRDPDLYDLVVNVGTLGIEGAADTVVRAYEVKFRKRAGKID